MCNSRRNEAVLKRYHLSYSSSFGFWLRLVAASAPEVCAGTFEMVKGESSV